MKVVLLFGLRRSGNHFVVSTLLQQFENYVHMNDVKNISYSKFLKYKETPITKKRDDGWLGFKNCDFVCISCENMTIDLEELKKYKTNVVEFSALLLIRCPYDHISSVWKVYEKNLKVTKTIMTLWKKYADLFLQNDDDLFCKIVYDKFVADFTYRQKCLRSIANPLVVNDDHIIRYQKSSFNDTDKQRKLYSSLETCNYCDDSKFTSLFDDDFQHKWESIQKKINESNITEPSLALKE